MGHMKKMIESNPNWIGKAKIIGISFDNMTTDVTKVVTSKKWKSIEHYRMLKGWDFESDLFKYLRLNGLPFVVLVNKWKRIVYLGYPDYENLEIMIAKEIQIEQEQIIHVQDNACENKPEAEELLTKEEYRQLKLQTQTLQSALKEAAFEKGSVTISLEKINIWKPDGSKELLKRSKFVLDYMLCISEEKKLNSFLQNNWFTIPEHHRRVSSSVKILDPVKLQKELQKYYKQEFSTLGVSLNYQNQVTTTFSYDTKSQVMLSNTHSGYFVEAENLTPELYKLGMEKMQKYWEDFREYNFKGDCEVEDTTSQGLLSYITLGIGKQFEPIENYKKWGKEEYAKIEHTQGQVLLAFYWKYDRDECDDCDQEIEKNTKLLQKVQEVWGNTVRVVALSLVLEEEAKDYMNTHLECQQYIDFYFPKEEKQSDIFKYSVQSQPHYVVVDKFGTIRKIEGVENIRQLVTELLKEQISLQELKNNAQIIQQVCIEQLKTVLLNEEINKTLSQFNSHQILELELTINQKSFGEIVIIEQPKLSYFIRDTQVQQFQAVLQKIFDIIPKENWNISKSISKTVLVEYPGNICVVCQKDISLEAQQYYSPFKSEHVCTECAEADDTTKIGIQRYKYHDTLIFINGPLSDLSVLKDIDDHKIGRNIKLKNGEIGSQKHHMNCNGCEEDILVGPRYISLSAHPGKYRGGLYCLQTHQGYIDFCQKCFTALKDKTLQRAIEIVAKTAAHGMVLDSLFTRVLFDYGGYTEF